MGGMGRERGHGGEEEEGLIGKRGGGEFTAKISHSSSVPPRDARTSAFEAFIQNLTFLARTMVSYFCFFLGSR